MTTIVFNRQCIVKLLFMVFCLLQFFAQGQNLSNRLKHLEKDPIWSDEKIKYYLEEAHPEAMRGDELLEKAARYLYFGQAGEAVRYFKRFLAEDPANVAVINLIGVCYGMEQEYDSALIYFDKAIAEYPGISELYCERGGVKIIMGDTANGIRDIRYACSMDTASYVNLYNMAIAYGIAGKTDSAILTLDRASRLEPDLIQPHLLKGKVYAEQGDHQQAINCYSKAIELDSAFVGTYLLRGHAFLNRYDMEHALDDLRRTGLVGEDSVFFSLHIMMHVLQDFRKAIFYYKRWIEEDTNSIPKNFFGKVDGNEFSALLHAIAVDSVDHDLALPQSIAHAMYHLCDFEYDSSYYLMRDYLEDHPGDVLAGRILMLSQYQREDVRAAESTVAKLAELDTTLVYVNAMKAEMMEQQGDYHASLKYSGRALRRGPGYFWAWNLKAWALYSLGRYDEAIEACNQGIAIKPDEPNTYNTRGLSYNALGEYSHAEKDFLQALQLDPVFCYSLGNMAMVLTNQGRINEASAYAKKAVHQCPDMKDGYNQRARIYMKLKMPDLALQDRNTIIDLEPGNPENYYIRGRIYHEMGEDEKAKKDFRHAIELNPDIVWPYLNLGSIYMTEMEYDKAESLFLRAHEIAPDNEYPCTGLGYIYRERYDNKKSRIWFEKAVAINPDNDYALSYLGYIELVIGDQQKAYDYFSRAYRIESARGDRQYPMTEKLRYLIREDFKAAEAEKILREIYGLSK